MKRFGLFATLLICLCAVSFAQGTSGSPDSQKPSDQKNAGSETNSSTSTPGTSTESKPTRVRISADALQALLKKTVPPVYPPDIRSHGIQGFVVMKVIVNDKGDVKDVSAISGHPSLVRPAIEAVSKWKFKPYLLEGKPVEVESQVTINFSLGGGGR